MQTRDIVGFILIPLVILTAVVLAEARVFSGLWIAGSILWMLRLAAYSLLVVGGTALLCQATPGHIPIRIVFIVWVATCGLILLKFLWDVYLPLPSGAPYALSGPGRATSSEEHWLYAPDLIGFAVVLLGTFLIPRATVGRKDADPENQERTARMVLVFVAVLATLALTLCFLVRSPDLPNHQAAAQPKWDILESDAPEGRMPADIPIPRSQVMHQSFAVEEFKHDDLFITSLTIGNVRCLSWAPDGKSFYALNRQMGIIHHIRLDGFKEERRLEVNRPCSWMCGSSEGLLLCVHELEELWVLDGKSLEVTNRLVVPFSRRDGCWLPLQIAVASPVEAVAFAVSEDAFHVLDLKKPEIVVMYSTPSDFRRVVPIRERPQRMPDDRYSLAITPDGKRLFFCYHSQVHRFRVDGTRLTCEGTGPALNFRSENVFVSQNGEHVAVTGRSSATCLYRVNNLTEPMLTAKPMANKLQIPKVIAFDPTHELIYTHGSDHQLLLLLVVNFQGEVLKQYRLPLMVDAWTEVKELLIHPCERKLLLMGGLSRDETHALHVIELPK